jgi:hypothetical protein
MAIYSEQKRLQTMVNGYSIIVAAWMGHETYLSRERDLTYLDLPLLGEIGEGGEINRDTWVSRSAVAPCLERRGGIQMVIAQEGLCCDRKWLGGRLEKPPHTRI